MPTLPPCDIDLAGLPDLPSNPTITPPAIPGLRLPSGMGGTDVYDYIGGNVGTINAGITQTAWASNYYPVRFHGVAAKCAQTGFSVRVNFDNTNDQLVLARDASGYWSVTVYDGPTGAVISTYTAPTTSESLSYLFPVDAVITVTTKGALLSFSIIAGANNVTALGYAIGGGIF